MLLIAGAFVLVGGVIAVLLAFFLREPTEPEVMVVPQPPRTVAPNVLDSCFTQGEEGELVIPTNEGLEKHLRGLVYRDLQRQQNHWERRTPMPQDAVLEDVEIEGFYRTDENRILASADYGVDTVIVKVEVNRYCQLTYWYTGPWPPY